MLQSSVEHGNFWNQIFHKVLWQRVVECLITTLLQITTESASDKSVKIRQNYCHEFETTSFMGHAVQCTAFSALTLLVGRQKGHPACKKTEWWGARVVICLEQGADLHMAQLMPLPLTVSCFSKIQTGFTFLVLAHPGSPGQRAIKQVSVCVCVCTTESASDKSVKL